MARHKVAEEIHGELWEVISGFSNYAVSNLGRVMNISSGKLISLHNREGYLRASIKNDAGKRVTLSVNIVVATAFILKENDEADEVNHKNGDKLDNKSSNLEWMTHQQNMQHAYDTGLRDRRKTTGELNPVAVLNEDTVHKICQKFQSGLSISAAQKALGLTHLSHACLGNIKNRKNWTQISASYNW
jgi:hypothetical protein